MCTGPERGRQINKKKRMEPHDATCLTIPMYDTRNNFLPTNKNHNKFVALFLVLSSTYPVDSIDTSTCYINPTAVYSLSLVLIYIVRYATARAKYIPKICYY